MPPYVLLTCMQHNIYSNDEGPCLHCVAIVPFAHACFCNNGGFMKIAVEITVFGHVIKEVVDYPGQPASQAEVIQWLMNQTGYRWADYENAAAEDRQIYHLDDSVVH